ncbi:Ras-GEF domain-containing member 1B [Branchiostoma belcheri]|nr:Ras-GEF domain-containing member 1B [Branchiostoma belcheri]
MNTSDEDVAISCLVADVKDSVENFRRIMSTVSFGKCHLSSSPSRTSQQRLERRDKTYTRAWQIQPSEIARELAVIERDLLVRVLEAELVDCVWTGHDKEKRAPNITKMVAFFERLVHLVGSEVMHEETPESRANVISGFITVADHCRVMRNFNSLRAVLAGYSSCPCSVWSGPGTSSGHNTPSSTATFDPVLTSHFKEAT